MDLRNTPVTAVTGVGEKRAEELEQLGIRTVEDLLTYFPYRYDDYRLVDLTSAEHEERVTVLGKLLTIPSIRWYGGKKSRISAKLDVDGLAVQVVWFNQAYLKSKLQMGQSLMVSGKWDRHRLQITADRTFFSSAEQEKQAGRLLPVYSISGGIKVAWLRKTIHQAFLQFGRHIEEMLPAEIREQYRLMDRAQAMYRLHFPRSREEGSRARRRMAYEELFLYELKLLHWRRQTRERVKGIAHEFDTGQVKQLIEGLPFSLTGAQQRVVREILDDMRSPEQMHRLLQGDVGSGKTVIAAIALYANYLSGCQGALMVPTEILAEQHLQSLRKILEPHGVRLALLTGSLTTKERREVLSELQMGLADVVVGTHALIQEPVMFHRLGLVITDEQHRFGVKQRARFREKGEAPDVLHMTATPIPRTLAITVYGDMDVSVIDEMPAGRQPVDTYWVKSDVWPRVVQFIAKECRNHHQAYVICPLIDESEKLDLQNAQAVYEELTQSLAPVRVGLLHGKMSPAEKEEVMRRFAANDIQVLVSTTVVEVGVNVPNATVMVVYDADRFGLAQLHQLRGRVGRGGGAATCILVADPKTETGVERMRIMTETTDGFEIAQRDLELRGPGDFFGVKQSGLPDFRVADVVEDAKILEIARTDAIRLITSSDFWQRKEWSPLHRYLRSLDEEGQVNFD
jgi:ATP-dependent DNA helicase RecG